MKRRSRCKKFIWLLVCPVMLLLSCGIIARHDSAAEAANRRGVHVEYELVDIGPLPWVADDTAPAISETGEISAWHAHPDGTIHASIWKSGLIHDLGTLSGDGSSISKDLNSHEQVVGWFVSGKNLVDNRASMQGFFYTSGHMTDIGTLGGRDSQARGVNKSGRVVGVSSLADNTKHGFLYAEGKLKDLGTLAGGMYSVANAISDSGTIAGAAETPEHLIHAVLWQGKTLVDLGTLPGGMRSRAVGLNNKGDIVGFSEVGGGKIHAFVYTMHGMHDLGSLGDEPIRADSVNNRGQIVGLSGVNEHVRHAFLWQNGQMADLNGLIGVNATWDLGEAVDINDQGQIVCVATGPGASRDRRLLLLKPLTTRKSNRNAKEGS
jgi:probable HAF family extracellular repeat protein